MRYVFLLLLTGCSSLYFPEPIEGMQIIEVVHTDLRTLNEACGESRNGRRAEACSIQVGLTCTLHLPERYSPFLYDHELTHCYGRQDAPEIASWRG